MKAIETIKKGEQYAAVTVGSINEIKDHELEMGPGVVIPGKVFCGQALGLTGAEISDFFTHTRHTKKSTSSSRAKDSIRSMVKYFQYQKEALSESLLKANVRSKTRALVRW